MDFMEVDRAITEVKSILHRQKVTTNNGRVFYPEWTGTGGDYFDEELAAATKDIRFRIPKLVGWSEGVLPEENDDNNGNNGDNGDDNDKE